MGRRKGQESKREVKERKKGEKDGEGKEAMGEE